MKTRIQAQHKNAKTNIMHKTHKNLHTIVKFAKISNHQK